MVRKETCPHCKGNKYVHVAGSDGKTKHQACPQCGGNGYRIRLEMPHR